MSAEEFENKLQEARKAWHQEGMQSQQAPVNCGIVPISWGIKPKAPYQSIDFYSAELDVSEIDSIVDIYPVGAVTYDANSHTLHWGGDGSSVCFNVGLEGGKFTIKVQPKAGVNAGSADLVLKTRGQAQPNGVMEVYSFPPVRYSFENCAPVVPPVSAFTMTANGITDSTLTIKAGTPVVFDPSPSVGSDSPIIEYEWDFGDGRIQTAVADTEMSVIYAKAGLFYPQLKVTNSRKASSINLETFLVNVQPPDLGS